MNFKQAEDSFYAPHEQLERSPNEHLHENVICHAKPHGLSFGAEGRQESAGFLAGQIGPFSWFRNCWRPVHAHLQESHVEKNFVAKRRIVTN